MSEVTSRGVEENNRAVNGVEFIDAPDSLAAATTVATMQITEAADENFESADRCNLIVNYLPQEFDDDSLAKLFSHDGELSTTKVIRDKVTKKSLGYGFVKFVNAADAYAALEAKNGLVIGHKKLKVSFARPASNDIKNCKVYITNLPKSYEEHSVRELFSSAGEIMECRVLKEKDSQVNRGVAFVQFANKKQCDAALLMDSVVIEGSERPLSVKLAEDFKRKKNSKNKWGNAGNRSNRINRGRGAGLNRYMGISDMRLGHDGYVYDTANKITIPSLGILTDQSYKNMNPGYNPQDGESMAMSPRGNWMGVPHGGQRMLYEQMTMNQYAHANTSAMYMSSPRTSLQSSQMEIVSLHVANLPSHVDVALLLDIFAPYGRIVSAKVEDNTVDVQSGVERFSGSGVVQMEGLQSAYIATHSLSGAILYKGGRPLSITMANK